MKTIEIKGRPYITVIERLKEFHKLFPDRTIIPEIIQVDPDWIVMKATIYGEDGRVFAVGHASERREGNINKTSYVENCETSAVGRALGLMGIGLTDDIASADEIALARDPEPDQIAAIEKLLESSTLDEKQRQYVEEEIVGLTYARAEKCIAYLMANQRDPIDSGDNYTQGDIHKKLTRQGA